MVAIYEFGERYTGKRPIAFHGTSLQSGLELIQKGRIQPPKPEELNHTNVGWMYFMPRKKAFRRHYMYNLIEVDFEDVLKSGTEDYAKSEEIEKFLEENKLEFLSHIYHEDLVDLLEDWQIGKFDKRELNHFGLNVKKLKKLNLSYIKEEIKKRNGIIIGLNGKALNLEISDTLDDPGREIMIHLPQGLEVKYVRSIHALGELEENAIDQFLISSPNIYKKF